MIAGDPEKRKAFAKWWSQVLGDNAAIERWARKECREVGAGRQSEF